MPVDTPAPRLQIAPGNNSIAARRAMILPRVKGQGRDFIQWHPQFTGKGGAVLGDIALTLFRIDHHRIHQHTGNFDVFGMQGVALGEALHLDDDDAARPARGLGHRQHLTENRFPLHADVAILIGGGAAQKSDIDVNRFVEKPLLSGQFHQLDQVFLGRAALFAPAVARVDKGVQTDVRDQTRPPGGHLPHQLRQRTLRQSVGLDGIFLSHFLDGGRVDQRSGDDTFEQAGMRQTPHALRVHVANADRVQRGDLPGRAGLQETLFHSNDQRFRHGMAAA